MLLSDSVAKEGGEEVDNGEWTAEAVSKRERFIFSAPARLATFSLYLCIPSSFISVDAGAEADLNRAAVIEREKASDDDEDGDRRRRECHVAAVLFSEPELKLCIDRRVR